jgi:hypothetical protein
LKGYVKVKDLDVILLFSRVHVVVCTHRIWYPLWHILVRKISHILHVCSNFDKNNGYGDEFTTFVKSLDIRQVVAKVFEQSYFDKKEWVRS